MKQENLMLVYPSQDYLESYRQACRENKDANVAAFSFHDPDEFESWRNTIFQRYENYRNGIHMDPGHVPSTTFWLVENGEFIGMGNIRHRLNENLERFGGHIGYGIRPSKWKQGYGTFQLSLLLKEAAKLGIEKALITCNDSNLASARVIEKNGGLYQDTIENIVEGKPRMSRRYWVDTGYMKNCNHNTAFLFDLDNRDIVIEDLPFYLEYGKEAGNVLELGCGTGRVAIPLAKAGIAVTGLDISEEMLDVFRGKIAGSEEAERIRIVKGNMAGFSLDRKFDLITMPFRAFQCLTEEEDIKNCLKSIREHLTEEGRFIINVFRPYGRLDQSWVYPVRIQWERDVAEMGHVVKNHSGDKIDLEKQILYVTFVYEVTGMAGEKKAFTEKLSLKYYYYEQLRDLLAKSGFGVVEEMGWYDKSPVENNRELIFVCKKAAVSKLNTLETLKIRGLE